MSDGPIKLAPPDGQEGGPALDDIILGDDDQTVPTPAVRPVVAAAAAAAAVSDGPPPLNLSKKRAKMTLRIPDDEVSRPQLPATTPMHGVPAVSGSQRPPSDPGLRPPSDPGLRPGSNPDFGTSGSRPPPPLPPAARNQRQSSPDFGSRPPPPPPPKPSRPPSNPDLGLTGSLGSRPPPPMMKPSRPPSNPDAEVTQVMPARSADDTLELPAVDLEARGRAVGINRSNEPGWTPYQPNVTDGASADGGIPQAPMRQPAPTLIDDPAIRRGDSTAPPAMPPPPPADIAPQTTPEAAPSAPPESEEIPIDTEEMVNRDSFSELVTVPVLPTALDSEEIKIDDGERRTDPGEVSEIAPEDLVSVESLPRPHSAHAPPPLKGGPTKISNTPPPPVVTVTATALMSGVAPPGAATPAVSPPLAVGQHARPAADNAARPPVPVLVPDTAAATPIAPAVAARAPSAPPPQHAPSHPPGAPPVASAPQPSHAPTPPQPPPSSSKPHLELSGETPAGGVPMVASGTPMARRPQPAGGPFGFMPQVGALAPPPMNEAAANRKKTRPWWEDLFNDDFIRTMAKITDGDIAREVNFIEESLGCEAGATILDLACGTGRHAVELATRGYQVVGFDLSLAMLARASDEAQDRKQKINFVQGDMREMTFEETFDGIFSWNTSFGFFDEEKNAGVIAKVHRALKKGGQFLLDVVNRDNLVRQAPSLAWFEGDGCICMDEMQIDFITSRMRVKRTLMMDDGRTKEIEYSIRIYSLHELGKMLHDNGFRVAEVSGRTGTPGVFFGCESPRTLILAEKR